MAGLPLHELLNAISDVDVNQTTEFGRTNTAAAIVNAWTMLTTSSNSLASKTIILVTDGQPNNVGLTRTAINTARFFSIKFGVVQSTLFDGQKGYRPSDFDQLFSGEEQKILTARSELSSVVGTNFCPIGASIFD